MIKIVDGHFCKNKIPEDAATFDLKNTELKTSFHSLLDVILHAAITPKPDQPQAAKQKETVIQTEDKKEKFEISIPPIKVS